MNRATDSRDASHEGTSAVQEALSIIVVNYGSSALLRQNLHATASALPDARVVVVDNPTTPGERAEVAALAVAHGWSVVAPAENLGFGGGMNAGVARARALGARVHLLLNPDATIDAASVAALRDADDGGTLLAPRIVDGRGRPWFDGADVYLADGRTRGARHRAGTADAERWEWLTGACLMVPDALWDRVGGFDEDYFLYWEDVDLSRRVIAAGGRLRVVDDARAVHDEGGTHRDDEAATGAKSPTYYYFSIRNRLLFAVKHLDEAGVRRWRRGAPAAAWEVLLRGGRRQFLRPIRPVWAGLRALRDGDRIARAHLRSLR